MGVWPFGRKSSHRKPKGRANSPPPDSAMHKMGKQRDAARQEGSPPPLERNTTEKGKTNRRASREPNKLQRDPKKRTYSFSPGRNDTIRVPKDIHQQHPVPPLPAGIRRNTEGMVSDEKDWQRVPTLHKRSAQDLPRRKSSKKRKEDHDREAEIKAMSSFMPMRAATEYGLVGRPMKKDSKRVKGGLGRNFTNPSSDISLPVPDSIHSSMSSGSERRASYKLRGMDVFAPRPTIRYAENPRYVPGAAGSGSDDESKKRRIIGGEPIPEEVIKAKKRVDDLADDLGAGDLRELMERDQRRRERKKLSDQEKMQRRLARRAEKQRAAETEAAQNGVSPPKNMERGVMGRELVGLGIDPVTSTRRASDASARRRANLQDPGDDRSQSPDLSPAKPNAPFHRSESLAGTDGGSPTEEREEPVIGTAQVARLSRASMSPPASPRGHKRGASSISQMMELDKAQTDVPPVPAMPEQLMREQPVLEPPIRLEQSRTSSEASAGKAHQHHSWTSFFKRSSKQKRSSIPSSFSNTSRESTTAMPQPPQVYTAPRPSVSSGVPKRTMSRFREDLPETKLPISPPSSRIQSPEADLVPPIRTAFPEKRGGGRGSMDTPSPFGEPNRRHDTPTSGYRSLEAARLKNETPSSQRSDVPSPEPVGVLSQSLASIDSEGSWLSGRPRAGSKRSSAQLQHHPLRDSASSIHRRHQEYSESAEELGIAEDEYFGRLTPGPEDHPGFDNRRRASGNPMPSSDEEDGGSLGSPAEKTKWGAVGRHPRVVHTESRAKSREGLLNDNNYDSGDDVRGETPQDLADRSSFEFQGRKKSDEATVSRATSVNLSKGHVRHLSAGSARLLDLKPRQSGESRRASMDLLRKSGESNRLNTVEGEVA